LTPLGCLTSESEERETWTAESLRAARHVGRLREQAVLVLCSRTRLRRYTFQVNTITLRGMFSRPGNRAGCVARGEWWDLVKRCDQPELSSHPT
jgi:hypothetical protein